MKRGPIIVFVVLLILVISVSAVIMFDKSSYKNDEEATDFCISTEDCVPEPVCHPTACISSYKSQEYKQVYCTEVCIPGTLDCGQGSCLCVNNRCKAVIDK